MAQQFFVKSADLLTSRITGSEANHIKNVLRQKAGDIITLFDDSGYQYLAEIKLLEEKSVHYKIIDRFITKLESPFKITLAQAYLKEKKMDFLIRPITELGVFEWIPFIAERSIARPDAKRLKVKAKRWVKISKESQKQCKRGFAPIINLKYLKFSHIIQLGKKYDLKIIFWENELNPLSKKEIYKNKKPENALIVIGPEGGFTKNEIDLAIKENFFTAAIGPRILKAETATIAACTMIQYLFGDLSKKKLDKE